MTAAILYQIGKFTVRSAPKGYEVYEDGPTAAIRVASIGAGLTNALQRAIDEANRRANRTT